MKKSGIFLFCTLPLALVAILNVSAVGAPMVINGGFEDPVLGDGAFYAVGDPTYPLPSVPGWKFTKNDGEVGMLSTSGTGPWMVPTTGQCAAFLGGATIAQTIPGFVAGTATFSFLVQGYYSEDYGPLTVTLDGVPLTFGGVASIIPTGGGANGPMIPYTSDPVPVTDGEHTLTFIAGHWTFIDDVSISNVPEPSCIALLACGLITSLIRTRGKRN